MPRIATNPQTGETVQFDDTSGQWIPIGGAAPNPQGQRPTIDELQRQLGLTARAGVQGLTALPSLLAEIPRQALNLIPGVNFPPQQQAVSDLLSNIGLPKPENRVERIAGAGAESLSGAGGFIGLGKGLANIAPTLSKTLTTLPSMQALSATSGGTAGQTAAEMGAGPGAQFAASLLAGVGAPMAARGASQLFTYQTPMKEKVAEMIAQGSTDRPTAPYELTTPPAEVTAPQTIKESISVGAPRVIKDNIAQKALTQGFDDGVVAAIKGSSPVDRRVMLKMTNIMERGKQNAKYAATNRPSDVVGDTLMQRFSVIRNANKQAGEKLDSVANTLKRKPANIDPAVNGFVDDLSKMGVSFNDDMTLNYSRSDIEGLGGPQKIINHIFDRLSKVRDAHDAHRLKRFIDEQVSYGKQAEGLTGKSEGILKSLRRNIDGALDEAYPKYNDVNTKYSDTIKALDTFQSIAGKKMDLTGENAEKAVGTLLRRILSNTQSRVNILDSVNEIDGVAKKYGGKFNDDLITQLLYADELDRVFGPVARTSFQGQISQAIERAAQGKAGPTAMAMETVGKTVEKARGINNENALKSIKELLRRGQ